MRMVGLPRCHGKLGAKWVEVTTCEKNRAISQSGAFETWPATTS
jgi:hypothetical protein